MNTVCPHRNPEETYPYFSLPFCVGSKQTLSRYQRTIWEKLGGIKLEFSGLGIDFKNYVPPATATCMIELTDEKVKAFVHAIKQNYWFELYIDGLPISGAVGTERGEKFYIYTHKKFDISYNGNRIIDVYLTNENEELLRVGGKITFTYEVNWQSTTIAFNERADKYLDPISEERMHRIFFRVVLIILLGFATIIFMQMVREAFARFNRNKAIADLEKLNGSAKKRNDQETLSIISGPCIHQTIQKH